MFEHFELARESRCCLSEDELCHQGFVINLGNTQRKCSALCAAEDRRKFVRLPSEVFLDLVGPQLLALSRLCHDAHRSEEFFRNDAPDQMLRTVIGHENLIPSAWAAAETWRNPMPGFVICGNILPYDPYWSKLQATGNQASTRVSFPSYLLKEALEEKTTLKQKLLDWRSSGIECDIEEHGRGRFDDSFLEEPRTSKLFWKIQSADVQLVRELAAGSDGSISIVTWRGGNFVEKKFWDLQAHINEFEIVKRFSHPHIVYNFGVLKDETQSSCFMEYMSRSLFDFIVDRVERSVGDNEPPFSRYDSVDILLQIAEAMRYMHHEKVDVVHCDLKSMNILVSVINTSDSVEHYLVKVADFGSARLGSTSRSAEGFIPGNGTTHYLAPEVLSKRTEKTLRIYFPLKIDVYGFGIVAFEVLTGKNNREDYKRSVSAFTKGVIEGTVRPPLRAEVEKQKVFTQYEDLISLIERCWLADPRQRPSFEKICKELNKIRAQMPVPIFQDFRRHAHGDPREDGCSDLTALSGSETFILDQKLPQDDDSPRPAKSNWNCFRGHKAHKRRKF